MARIATNMRANGAPLGTALTMPFTVNEGYEQLRNRSSLKMPYQDIYSTYAGVQFALSGDKRRFTGPSYKEFQIAYHARGRKVAGEYFKQKFGAENVCYHKGVILPPQIIEGSEAEPRVVQ